MTIFDTIIDRSNTPSAKYDKSLIASFANNREATPFWVADMDFRSPQVVLDALQKEISDGILGYPSFSDTQKVFIDFAKQRHDWEVDPSLVAIAPGMLSSVSLLIEMYSKEGDSIILPFPSYKPFVSIIKGLKRKIVPWHLTFERESSSFSLDIEKLSILCEENNPSILLFCSPHNPTGVVFSKEKLQEVASVALSNNLMVISDEIHGDLAFKGVKHHPFHTIAQPMGLLCATCMAPSKTFNIAGEHFSIIICSTPEMRRKIVRRQQAQHIAPDLLATVSARAAYQKGLSWLNQLLDYLENNIVQIQKTLEKYKSSIKLVTPRASFIAFLDCSALYEKIEEDAKVNPDVYEERGEGGLLSRFFGVHADVAMNDGTWFGSEYYNFVRFNFAAPTSVVIEGITRLCEAEKKLG
jgi:cystathionine beta-lyase